jgi:hypothetical protein
MPAIKASVDVMVLVSLTSFLLLALTLIVLQAPCSNWYVAYIFKIKLCPLDHISSLTDCTHDSYFAAKDCTYTDSSGRPVPAPLASKTDKPVRAGPSQTRRRSQKDSYLQPPVSASTNSPLSPRGEPLASLQTPSDTRDEYAESSKRPRSGLHVLIFQTQNLMRPFLPSRSSMVATRFEVPVVRELVNRA